MLEYFSFITARERLKIAGFELDPLVLAGIGVAFLVLVVIAYKRLTR